MPQDIYSLRLGDSTTILVDVSHIAGFDTLSENEKHLQATQILQTILAGQPEEVPATFADFAVPIGLLIIFAFVVLWLAKRISKNPKLYDTIVKMDGEPNPEYGKGWRKENNA